VAQTGVTLAVLPFANLSADPAQDYFSDGLTEEILNRLARIPAVRLTGRTSSFSFKGRNEDLRQIGAKLGVAHLLEGSVRKDGDQLRVTAQLIRAEDGTQQWSKTYDRNLSSIFAVQDEIAKDVAQALLVKLDVGTLNRAQGGTTNVEAYDGYLRWRDFQLSERRDPAEARRMVQRLREAVALDPGFVLAWDGLAQSLTELAKRAQPAEAAQLRAEAAASHARVAALAPDSWIVQRERAYSLFAEGRWAEAIAIAKAIMESSPRSWEHTYPYINLIFSVGRLEDTARIVGELQAIEPLAMFVSRDQQWNLTSLRRYDEAEAEYQRCKALAGSYAEPEYIRFLRLLSREDTDPQALRDQYRLLQDSEEGNHPRYLQELAPVLGDRQGMLDMLSKEFAVRPSAAIAPIADALGDAGLALAALHSTGNGRSQYDDYWGLWISPYSALRTLPGYKALMRETGLADYWRQTGDWGDVCRPAGDDDFECR
jgi:TolB-like protein/tetratricopeptide (TPR) repeat protein